MPGFLNSVRLLATGAVLSLVSACTSLWPNPSGGLPTHDEPLSPGHTAALRSIDAARDAGTIAGAAAAIPVAAPVAGPAAAAANAYADNTADAVAAIRAEFAAYRKDVNERLDAALRGANGDQQKEAVARAEHEARIKLLREEEDRRYWMAAITGGIGILSGVAGYIRRREEKAQSQK